MSFYDPSYFTIYDLIDSLNQRRQLQLQQQQQQQQQQLRFLHPMYPTRYYQRSRPQPQQQQQPYYYFNIPRGNYENDEMMDQEVVGQDEEEDDYDDDDATANEDENPSDLLYRSLYGDGPYRSIRAPSTSRLSPFQQQQQQQQQQQPARSSYERPSIRRQPSLPRPTHPAESAVDLLNLLGLNIPYPEEKLPTRDTFGALSSESSPVPAEEVGTSASAAAAKTLQPPEVAKSSESGASNSTGLEEEQKEQQSPKQPQPTFSKRPSISKRKQSSLNLHASAPSPNLDPLQVSKPQLNKKLPFSPPINVYDMPGNYLVVVSIPGSDKNSFHVDFHPTSHDLIVKGEIKNKYHDADSTNDQYLKVSEQRFGSFERNIKFPTLPKINDDEIKAVYNNGLLEITIPKLLKSAEPPVSKRRITIEEVEDEELQREEGLLS